MALLQESPKQDRGTGRNTILINNEDSSNVLVLEMLLQLETPYHILCFATVRDVFQRIEEIKALKPVLFVFGYQLESLMGLALSQQLSVLEGLEQSPHHSHDRKEAHHRAGTCHGAEPLSQTHLQAV